MKTLQNLFRLFLIAVVYIMACIVAWLAGTLIVSFFPHVGYYDGYVWSIVIGIIIMLIFTFALIVSYKTFQR